METAFLFLLSSNLFSFEMTHFNTRKPKTAQCRSATLGVKTLEQTMMKCGKTDDLFQVNTSSV